MLISIYTWRSKTMQIIFSVFFLIALFTQTKGVVNPIFVFAFMWNCSNFNWLRNFLDHLLFMSSCHLILILKLPLVTCCAEALRLMLSICVLACVGHLRNTLVNTALLAHALVKHVSICMGTCCCWVLGSFNISFFLSVFSGITISAQA